MSVRSALALVLSGLCWSVPALAREVPVTDVPGLSAALAAAQAGDVISLAPGTYRLVGANCVASGAPGSPIVVRSSPARAAKIEFTGVEGFKVSGAHWTFEGLDLQGVCAADSDCEHAFHVYGAADGFVLRDSRVRDFNAQLKVNAAPVPAGSTTRVAPNGGLVERCELSDSRARATSNPVTKLNIDGGKGWVVRDNLLFDFQKGGGDGVSYGAFMKSGGQGGVFERNLVLCSRLTTGGTRIGLSFGGGGTGNQYCAPAYDAAVPCDPEHLDGVMRNNVIVGCSDVGIYLNKARNTQLLHNTLIGTSGVDFRFASSTGRAERNVLTSVIRGREGGTFSGSDNLINVSVATFAGWYQAPLQGDLRARGDLSALLDKAGALPEVTDDFCGRTRSAPFDLGALEHSLGDCPAAGTVDAGESPPDAGVGVPDAGPLVPDAGLPASDAGLPASDAGAGEPPGLEEVRGCGCSSAQDVWAPGMLLALAAAVRRRRPKPCRDGLAGSGPSGIRAPRGYRPATAQPADPG